MGAILGVPIRFAVGSGILVALIVIPQVLNSFGFTNDIVAFFLFPLVAFAILTFIFCLYLAPLILNPARFMIVMPFLLILAGVLTYGLYM